VVCLTAGCTSYRIVRDGEVNPRALDELSARTAEKRELEFKHEVRAEVLTKDESRAFFVGGEEDAEHPAPETEAPEDRVAHRLGLLPDGLSLSDVFGRALAGNAAGVYLPPSAADEGASDDGKAAEGRLFIVDGILPQPLRTTVDAVGYVTGTDWANTVYLSHELIHALQDQHYGLDGLVSPAHFVEDRDRALARKAVLESEANLFSQALLLGVDLNSFVQRRVLIGYLLLAKELDVEMARWMTPDVPPFYVRLLVEQYSLGLRYLKRLTDDEGVAGLNAAYPARLPRSTEQLLFPSRGLGEHPDEPRNPAPLDLANVPALGGASLLGRNVFGALSLRLLLEPVVGRDAALEVARGWGGDRYEVVDLDERTVLLWRTVWDEESDAQQFVSAYLEVLEKKYPGRLVAEDGASTTADSPSEEHRFRLLPKSEDTAAPGVRTVLEERVVVVRDGARVVVVEGAEPGRIDAVVAALWPLTEAEAEALVEAAAPTTVPPPARPEPDLLRRRVFLPHHLVAVRMGGGVSLRSPDGQLHAASVGVGLERELRWGFRQHLEWSPPFLFSLELPGESRLQSVLTLGISDALFLPGPDVYLGGRFALTEALHLHRRAAVVVQASVDGGAAPGGSVLPWLEATLSGGMLLAPLDGLVFSFGVGWREPLRGPLLDEDLAQGRQGLLLGAVERRGAFTQPTIELRLIDELFAYEASTATLGPTGLLVEQRHVAGLLLYF